MHRRPRAQASDQIHAHHKEFYLGKNDKTYAKGHAAKYWAYMIESQPDATHMAPRGQKGSRHDQVFEACLVVFINRLGCVEFMDVACESASLLVDANYINLTAVSMIALYRAFDIFFLVVIEAWRFFAGTDDFDRDDDPPGPLDCEVGSPDDAPLHSARKWSPLNMSPIYDAVEKALMASSVNGAFFMEPENRDIYMDVLEPEDKPTYRAWKEHLRSRRTRKPGGALVAQRAEIEKRIFDPTDATDLETDEECAEILKVLSVNFLAGLYTPKAADYLASKLGTYSVPKITPAMKERMAGFLRTNDKGGESPIANFKYVYEMFTNIGWMAANAVATARTNHTFAIAAPSAGARGAYKSGETTARKSTPVDGAFVAVGRQSSAAQDALVRVARRDRLATKRDLKRTLAFQQQRWKALAKEAKQEGLNSIKLKFKKALIYHSKWDEMYTSIRTTAQLTSAIVACPNKTRQLAFLKGFINSVAHGIDFLERGYVEQKPFSKKKGRCLGRYGRRPHQSREGQAPSRHPLPHRRHSRRATPASHPPAICLDAWHGHEAAHRIARRASG